MKKIPAVLIVLLLFLVTSGYCWFIELSFRAFNLLLAKWKLTALSNFTIVASTASFPWQVAAFVALFLSIVFALVQRKRTDASTSLIAGAVVHIVWLFTCLMAHGIGFLLPFIPPDTTIK